MDVTPILVATDFTPFQTVSSWISDKNSCPNIVKTIEEKDAQIEEMKPHAILGQAITTANTSILVGDMAKILRQNGVNIGGRRLFEWLRENGYLIKRKGTDWNLPTQRSVEQGLFEIKESVHVDGNGCNKITRTPKITGKGQQYFVNKFLKFETGKEEM